MIDEVMLGQLSQVSTHTAEQAATILCALIPSLLSLPTPTSLHVLQVVRQTAHREPELSLFEYYGLLPKIKKLAERSVREDAGREGTNNASSHFQIVKPSTLAALRSLQVKKSSRRRSSSSSRRRSSSRSSTNHACLSHPLTSHTLTRLTHTPAPLFFRTN